MDSLSSFFALAASSASSSTVSSPSSARKVAPFVRHCFYCLPVIGRAESQLPRVFQQRWSGVAVPTRGRYGEPSAPCGSDGRRELCEVSPRSAFKEGGAPWPDDGGETAKTTHLAVAARHTRTGREVAAETEAAVLEPTTLEFQIAAASLTGPQITRN